MEWEYKGTTHPELPIFDKLEKLTYVNRTLLGRSPSKGLQLSEILSNAPNFNCLYFPMAKQLDSWELIEAAGNKLKIFGAARYGSDLEAQQWQKTCPDVKDFRVFGWAYNCNIGRLHTNFPGLERLHIEGLTKYRGEELMTLLKTPESLPNLRYLSIGQTNHPKTLSLLEEALEVHRSNRLILQRLVYEVKFLPREY